MATTKAIVGLWTGGSGSGSGSGSVAMDLVRSVACRELREEDGRRDQALASLRAWLCKNPDVANVRTDNSFLLRFLRAKKYSVPMAQQMLLKYLNLRKNFSYLINRMDPLDPAVDSLISSGFMFASPFKDQNDRRVVFYIGSKLDPSKYRPIDLGRVFMMTFEVLMEDEYNQIMGLSHVSDISQISVALLTFLTPNEFATVIKWGEQSVPLRHKEIHVFNVPTALKYVYDFATNRLSEKMRSRVRLYDNINTLTDVVDSKVLPKEYGGTMPMAEMIDLWKKELLAKRDMLLALDEMELISDRGIITRKNSSKQVISNLPGSFRKLEVD